MQTDTRRNHVGRTIPSVTVKLLMSWDILPGQEQTYFEFAMQTFAPALIKLGWQPTSDVQRAYYLTALGRYQDAVKTGPAAVEPLIAVLKDRFRSSSGSRVAGALGKLGDKRAVEPLIAALKHPWETVRRPAALALGRLGGERAVEALIAALKHKDPALRHSAALALGRSGDQRAVEPLTGELIKKYRWEDEAKDVKDMLVVTGIEPLGEARALGIEEGDLIVSVSVQGRNQPIKSVHQLQEALSEESLADGVRIRVKTRDSGYRTFFERILP